MVRNPEDSDVWAVLESVLDPEVPAVSIVELGMVRFVERTPEAALRVGISPTYTGCPATDVIVRSAREALEGAGYASVEIETVLSPPWTTDWITEEGRAKLEAYGIAPPVGSSADKRSLFAPSPAVRCPRCKSLQTTRVSNFGSTACKALYQCDECREPFDYFKCL
jgi:ring-1,2-phenylacetyl-CoA epoxidase subunit PaaD